MHSYMFGSAFHVELLQKEERVELYMYIVILLINEGVNIVGNTKGKETRESQKGMLSIRPKTTRPSYQV